MLIKLHESCRPECLRVFPVVLILEYWIQIVREPRTLELEITLTFVTL